MTFIKAFDLEAVTGQEVLSPSSSVNMLSELDLQDANFNAVIKSLTQYRKTFDSGYDAPF